MTGKMIRVSTTVVLAVINNIELKMWVNENGGKWGSEMGVTEMGVIEMGVKSLVRPGKVV
jgi:hypothetical protein